MQLDDINWCMVIATQQYDIFVLSICILVLSMFQVCLLDSGFLMYTLGVAPFPVIVTTRIITF